MEHWKENRKRLELNQANRQKAIDIILEESSFLAMDIIENPIEFLEASSRSDSHLIYTRHNEFRWAPKHLFSKIPGRFQYELKKHSGSACIDYLNAHLGSTALLAFDAWNEQYHFFCLYEWRDDEEITVRPRPGLSPGKGSWFY